MSSPISISGLYDSLMDEGGRTYVQFEVGSGSFIVGHSNGKFIRLMPIAMIIPANLKLGLEQLVGVCHC